MTDLARHEVIYPLITETNMKYTKPTTVITTHSPDYKSHHFACIGGDVPSSTESDNNPCTRENVAYGITGIISMLHNPVYEVVQSKRSDNHTIYIYTQALPCEAMEQFGYEIHDRRMCIGS